MISCAEAQRLELSPRAPSAPEGTQFSSMIIPLSRQEREEEIFRQVSLGNVPEFLRTLVPVTVIDTIDGIIYSLRYFVTPDYLSLGSDSDHVLMPMTPLLAQRIADLTGCMLPTAKMVDQIYAAADVKLPPQPIPPDAVMDKMPRFIQHNDSVRSLRRPLLGTFPLGLLVGGTKKDVVIDRKIHSQLKARVPKPVVIYGWHRLNGIPIQPAYNGHGESYADYSHGIRLVHRMALINGAEVALTDLLRDDRFALMISDTVQTLTRYPLSSDIDN
ncbi:MAG: hypothetical protein ACYC09_10500 [Bacteroidota bacterium]